jgi:hypothetical protein
MQPNPIAPALYNTAFCKCGRYRYEWSNRWADGPYVLFIGLNPSTANQHQTDPTVRRCIGYAKRWGFGALHMGNLFAFCATDPKVMKQTKYPVGGSNDASLKGLAAEAELVVAAWGRHGAHLGRDAVVKAMLPNLHALAVNRDGSPAHPLYLNGDLRPVPFPEFNSNT